MSEQKKRRRLDLQVAREGNNAEQQVAHQDLNSDDAGMKGHEMAMVSSAIHEDSTQADQAGQLVPAVTPNSPEYLYREVVNELNSARERGLPFKPAESFKKAYDAFLRAEVTPPQSVYMQKIWKLIPDMTRQGLRFQTSSMELAIIAQKHLNSEYENFIMDTISSHPTEADALEEHVGDTNLEIIRTFLRVSVSLDDTKWQQIYYCLRVGYDDQALQVAWKVSREFFAPMFSEWIYNSGKIPEGSAYIVANYCDMLLDKPDRTADDNKKLLLYTIIAGSRVYIERIAREHSTFFTTVEDLVWFKLACLRRSVSIAPYSLTNLQDYFINSYDSSHYSENGRDPFVYPYVLLLSIQLQPAVMYLSKEAEVDAVHIAICLGDRQVMKANAEASKMISQYGSKFLHQGDFQMAVEYYAQAAATVGGGQLAWSGQSNMAQKKRRNSMLTQLLIEIVQREGGVGFLLGAIGTGEGGQLARFFPDSRLRQQFLIEAARKCKKAGLIDQSTEIKKRIDLNQRREIQDSSVDCKQHALEGAS